MDHMEKSPAFRPAIKDVSPQLAAKLAGLDVIGATHSQHHHSHSLLFHLISRYALFLSQPYAFLFESLSPTLPYLIAGPLQSVRFSISHHTTQHNTTKLLTAHPSSASACYSSRPNAFALANFYSLRHPHHTHTHTPIDAHIPITPQPAPYPITSLPPSLLMSPHRVLSLLSNSRLPRGLGIRRRREHREVAIYRGSVLHGHHGGEGH